MQKKINIMKSWAKPLEYLWVSHIDIPSVFHSTPPSANAAYECIGILSVILMPVSQAHYIILWKKTVCVWESNNTYLFIAYTTKPKYNL